MIPSSVTHLTFGKKFNDCIRKRIPSLVKYLKFGERFSRSTNKCVPSSVKKIIVHKTYPHSLPTKDIEAIRIDTNIIENNRDDILSTMATGYNGDSDDSSFSNESSSHESGLHTSTSYELSGDDSSY